VDIISNTYYKRTATFRTHCISKGIKIFVILTVTIRQSYYETNICSSPSKRRFTVNFNIISCVTLEVVQSIYRLATSSTVRGSNPGGSEIFGTRPDQPSGPPSPLYSGYRVCFPGGEASETWLCTPIPHLAPRLRKE
jgi:hypothetical protein